VTRVLSGATLLVFFVGAAWWAPPAVLLVIALLVTSLAAVEYAGLSRALGAPVPATFVAVAAGAVCVATAWPYAEDGAVVMATVLASGILAVGRGQPAADSLSRVAAAVFGPLYVGLPIGAIVAVHWQFGREAMLLLLVVVIVSDTAQYYAGRALGRKPLAPSLSPKKTVEGAIGGLIAGSLTLVVVGHWWWPAAPVGVRAVLGATLVVLGITGDLFESLLKRAAGVKDSSHLIPGHGGVLDRVDALLFAAPVYYAVARALARP
jgi:phosphatidate cytidylyltransferase